MQRISSQALLSILLATAVPAIASDGLSGWGDVVGAPELDRWIADAAANSPTLDVRRGNVSTAEERSVLARSARRPDLSVQGDWRWGRENRMGADTDATTLDPFSGRASLEWEIDLFGRIRSAVGAARYAEEVAGRELEARELAHAAELAAHYVQGRHLAGQLALRRQAEKATEAIAGYLANRAAAGLVRAEEVDRARAATRDAEARVESSREQWELLAARWRYLAPSDSVPPLDEHRRELGPLPAPPPADDLHAYAVLRPDVRGAYAVRQKAGQVASAAARDRKPIATAIASGEAQGPSPVDDPEAWTAWAGIRLSLPVLTPERSAKTRIARSELRVSEALYDDAVSRAILDLQQSYARRIRAENRWRAARDAADLLKTRLASAEQRFEKGLAALPEVESARLSLLAAEEDALALKATALQEHLSLLRACGGP